LGFQPYQTHDRYVTFPTSVFVLWGGFSLIEAGAAGNPMIAYDVEWHYELVENHVTGFLVTENNIDMISNLSAIY